MATTLTVRLDDRMYNELSSLSQARGVTLSELARKTLGALVAGPLDQDEGSGSTDAPEHLTTVQRQELVLLHRIAARLERGGKPNADMADYHAAAANVFERGYTIEYRDQFIALESELSSREAVLVMDILDMFDRLEHSWTNLDDADRTTLRGAEHAIRFHGFDLNNRLEIRLHGYAKHLIDGDRWPLLAKYFDDKHEHGNSHMPVLSIYERMLAEFNPIWRRRMHEHDFDLSADDIRRVTTAGYPTRR